MRELWVLSFLRNDIFKLHPPIKHGPFRLAEISTPARVNRLPQRVIGVMHLAKGLEFKAVAVMACDEDQLPLKSRLEAVADETELDDVFDTER